MNQSPHLRGLAIGAGEFLMRIHQGNVRDDVLDKEDLAPPRPCFAQWTLWCQHAERHRKFLDGFWLRWPVKGLFPAATGGWPPPFASIGGAELSLRLDAQPPSGKSAWRRPSLLPLALASSTEATRKSVCTLRLASPCHLADFVHVCAG